MLVRVWCNEQQSAVVAKLKSCTSIKQSEVKPQSYIAVGAETLKEDINKALSKKDS